MSVPPPSFPTRRLGATLQASSVLAIDHQVTRLMQHSPETILSFWFEETSPKQWWEKSPAFDRLIAGRFGDLHRAAAACELFAWRATARGRLAEVLILDQLSRNIYRDTAQAFACDPLALALAQMAVADRTHTELDLNQRAFLYLPFMHSESQAIHAAALVLFDVPGMENWLAFERRHKAIIDRFGRYPHRNAVLGRVATPEEVEFLTTPGSSF